MNRVYFTDRNLGRRFPDVLHSAGFSVVRHDDHFGPRTPDEEWLGSAGRQKWVVITHDQRIRYRPNELDAVIRHKVSLLVIVGKTSFEDLARNFVRTRIRIESFLARHDPPFIARVTRPSPSELARNPAAPGRISLSWP